MRLNALSLAVLTALFAGSAYAESFEGSDLYVTTPSTYENVTFNANDTWYGAYLSETLTVTNELVTDITAEALSNNGYYGVYGNGGGLSLGEGGSFSFVTTENVGGGDSGFIAAVYNIGSGDFDLGNNYAITITNHSTLDQSIGVYNNGTITSKNLNVVITSNNQIRGLWGSGTGIMNVDNIDLDLDSATLGKGGTGYDTGILLYDSNAASVHSINSDSINITINSGSNAHGIFAQVIAPNISSQSITIIGQSKGYFYGILLEDNTNQSIEKTLSTDSLFLNLTGDNAYTAGLVMNGASYTAQLGTAEIHVKTTDSGSAGAMQILGESDAHNQVTVSGNLTLEAVAGNNRGWGALFQYADMEIAGDLNVTVHSDYVAEDASDDIGSYGLTARDDSQITVNGAANIAVSNNDAFMSAVFVRDNASTTFNSVLNASMSGKTDVSTSSVLSAIGGTISAAHGGVIDANGGLAARVSASNLTGDTLQGRIILSSDDSHTLTVLGDLYAQNASSIDVTLGQGSYLEGQTTLAGEGTISLDLNGGQWNPTGTSTVSEVHSEDGLISLEKLSDQDTVQIGSLEGKSLVISTETPNAGQVEVGSKATDSSITVSTSGEVNDSYRDAEELISDFSSVANDQNGITVVDSVTAAQGDIYGALNATNSNGIWDISRTENTKLQDYFSAASLSVLGWRHQMDDFHERMGEIRDNPDAVGAWARVYGSELEYGKREAKTQNTTVEIGADGAISPSWRLGAAFSYTDGDYDLLGGDGDHQAYTIGAYATYISETGVYFDLSAKYSRLDVDFDIENMSGNYNNDGFSVSAEAGHKFVFNETFFVEPQVGISYGYLKGDGFTASNGVKVEQDNFNSLVGRVGLRGGLTVKDKVSLYAKASVLHDFTGELDTSFTSTKSGSSVKLTDDFEDTWVEYGVGADFQVHQNLKTYAEFERSSSGSVDENWRFNVGMRYLF